MNTDLVVGLIAILVVVLEFRINGLKKRVAELEKKAK